MSSHQLSRDELRTLDPHEVRAALKEGRLADVLAGRDPGPPPDDGQDDQTDDAQSKQQLGKDDLAALKPEQVRDALQDGRLDQLLGRQ